MVLSRRQLKITSSIVGLLVVLMPFQNCGPSYTRSILNSSLDAAGTPVAPGAGSIVPPISTGKVQVFMAAGKIARTLISCDDGVSWINDRSDDDNVRCWVSGDPNYVECDHDSRSFTGLDVGSDGWFYTQYGWGFNGTVRRSRNSVNWEIIRSGGWGGGLAVAFNQLVSQFNSNMQISKDQGATFTPPTAWFADYELPFLSRAGSKLFSLGRGTGQLAVSLDGGDNWKQAANYETGWGGNGFAEGNGILVTTGTRRTAGQPDIGFASRSVDNGVTWTAVKVIPDGGWSMGVQFNGTEFIAWSSNKTWKSKDGITWTEAPMTVDGKPSPYWMGAASRNPKTGTYVSINGNWGSWYEKQSAIRSSDGITWTSLNAMQFKGGHPIAKIVSGEIDASVCGK